MSTVYVAQRVLRSQSGEEVLDENRVAIKELHKEFALNASYRTKFFADIKKFRSLHIANTLEVLDVIDIPGTLAIVTPFYEGKLLSQYIPKTGLSLTETLDIFECVGDAIDKMHNVGLVHGNITPHNILLTKKGLIPIVLDAGIFKNAHWMGCIQVSPYRSPEESSAKVVNPASDRYAFTLMVYETLSGQLPWNKRLKEHEILAFKETDRLDPISIHLSNVYIGLLAALMDSLSADKEARLSTCMELVNIMRKAIDADDQTNEFGNIDPSLLQRAQVEVAAIDKELSQIELKVMQITEKLAAEYAKLAEIIDGERETCFKEQSRLEQQIADLEQKIASAAPSQGGFAKLFGLGPKSDTEKMQKELKTLRSNFQIKIEALKVSLQAKIEEHKTKNAQVEEKLQAELNVLEQSSEELEEKLIEYQDIHPALLGFRATKPFSMATLKVSKLQHKMVLIPKGDFEMGADITEVEAHLQESPIHKVSLTQNFWILHCPVSQALYRAVTGKNPSRFKGVLHPVEQVTWQDAIRFCNALSSREKLQLCYEIKPDDPNDVRWNRQANGYRLLTEAEWEYVARAGTGTKYSGSNNAGEVAWFLDNSEQTTHPVCEKDANLWGIYDMSGNVWEWCFDWAADYTPAAQTDPMGAAEGKGRVFRGGSWTVDSNALRVSYRGSDRPHNKMDVLGFRIARNSKR